MATEINSCGSNQALVIDKLIESLKIKEESKLKKITRKHKRIFVNFHVHRKETHKVKTISEFQVIVKGFKHLKFLLYNLFRGVLIKFNGLQPTIQTFSALLLAFIAYVQNT